MNLLVDSFDNNDNSWTTGDDDERSIEIQNGKMTFQHKRTEGSYLVWNWSYMDGDYPFTIETSMKQTGGVDDRGYGVMWGVDNADNFYTFNISDNGFYRIGKMKEGEWTEYVGWTESYLINTYGSTNTLKLVKEGNKINFYINGTYVNQITYEDIFADGVGYVIWRNQTLDIDYLNVYGSDDWELWWDMLDDY
ncbi:MAG: hypothetical protein K9N09_01145 [Candidatus Cloacimonetes bacterium]|nr:hypothetical protein [Candidatus Cloacimonadota bacterium]